MNLRGMKESGKLFAIPTYVFVAGVFIMIAWGAFRGLVLGDTMNAPTADYTIKAEHQGLGGFALVFLLLRSFSSGCAALYNWVWFYNGYHAEHHFRPKVHWTRMVALHRQIADLQQREGVRVITVPHALGFLDRNLPEGTASGNPKLSKP